MIATISINRSFTADHFHNLPGFTESQHTHNWKVKVTFSISDQNNNTAYINDLDIWIKQVNNTILNNHKYLVGRNPTTELLTKRLYEFLKARNHAVVRVKIQEKDNYWAAYGKY